jgi:hypothetical protein
MSFRLYLDVCCLNRPFDDQSQHRIRLESEAVLSILGRIGAGEFEWSASAVMDLEIGQTADPDRRQRVRLLMGTVGRKILVGDTETARAQHLEGRGFQSFDALHLACAESAAVDIFLTTDDRLLRAATRSAGELHLRVENPLRWVQETFEQ